MTELEELLRRLITECGHTGAGVQWDGHMRLDDESEALVEKARQKIRARRKRAA